MQLAVSQMEVPAWQSYTAAVVRLDEHSATTGGTNVARIAGMDQGQCFLI
jgi:hypothetical protein